MPPPSCPMADGEPVNKSNTIDGPHPSATYTEKHPCQPGTPLHADKRPTHVRTMAKDITLEDGSFGPFEGEAEWDFAHWIVNFLGMRWTDALLKTRFISVGLCSQSPYITDIVVQMIDALPQSTKWINNFIVAMGDCLNADGSPMSETLELWWHNPVEIIRELVGNPFLKDHMSFEPKWVYTDVTCSECIYNKTWTGDWWWEKQNELPLSATVIPVILASDETCLSMFSSDKSAWPMYLTIGNISKGVR
ncbi:hypothetical protein M0805_009630 [Coniferiporia weirii]|nr:hypothetical protein M0805_009630 [Coniferiporia weirii]